jgi:glycerol-3-phosphate dehydrogenase (NAD(P)+)
MGRIAGLAAISLLFTVISGKVRAYMSVITIVGAGMMGSAMSIPAADNGHEVRLVGTPLDREIIERLQTDGVHPKHQRKLPETVRFLQIEELTRAIAGADLLINGVSSFGVDWFTREVLPLVPVELPVLSVTKGLAEADDQLIPFPYEMARKLHPRRRLSLNAIGGPCTSYELVDRNQTAVAFCGDDLVTLAGLKKLLATPYYHISLSTDVIGVECGVGLKNCYALGVTLAVGLEESKHGVGCPQTYNPQAALFGQSVKEMARLLKLLGGKDESLVFAAGDLYVTIFGGRTRKLGTLLGRGLSFARATEELAGITLESVAIASTVARVLRKRAANGKAHLSDYPLLIHIDDIINHGATVAIPWESFE